MPFPPSPMSLPQQPHGGGGAPPDPNAWVDRFMKKHPDAVKQPGKTTDAEEMIRQSAPQMREVAGLPPTPRSPGKNGGKGYPLDMLGARNYQREQEAMKNFPEVFGGAVPDFLQGNAIDDQKMLWESQMSDRPRDIQGPGQMLVPNQTPFYHP